MPEPERNAALIFGNHPQRHEQHNEHDGNNSKNNNQQSHDAGLSERKK